MSLLEIKNLKKSFGDNEVLKDISLEVNKGEVLCIIGPSGSGKSTYLRCINQMEEVSSGQILIDGQDITDAKVDINEVRQKVGMVFQNPNPFPMSIYDNIAYGPRCQGIKNKEVLNKIDFNSYIQTLEKYFIAPASKRVSEWEHALLKVLQK